MDLQEKYDELDNIISTLRILIDKINDKHYKYMFEEIKFEAQEEMEDVEKELIKEYDKEEKEERYQFDSGRL